MSDHMKSAVMIVNATPGYPFRSAAAALNTYFADCLRRRNYAVRIVCVHQPYVPLNALDILDDIKAAGPVDLAVYCDLSLWLEPLNVVPAKRTLVYFHGLVGTPHVWMTRYFDGLCCNSPWTMEVLRSLGGYPLWSDRQLLCPDIYQRSFHIRCVLPALGYPDGGIAAGEALPDEFYKRLDEDSGIIGLDSFWEADDLVHCQLIVAINAVAREQGDKRLFRLLTQAGKLQRIERWLNSEQSNQQSVLRGRLRALEVDLSHLLYPLPATRVKQAALFRLMRMCRFALMFNKIPESFGMMPLECVLNNCPVHTNGSGNFRYLLPPSHGIVVHHTDPGRDSSDWVSRTARSIYEHSLKDSAVACLNRQAQLDRGQRYIRTTYTPDAFEEDVSAVLRRSSVADNVALRDLRLAKGPLVWRWDRGDTCIVCDTGVVTLTEHQSDRGSELLGCTAAELFGADVADQNLISHLWKKGLLTWTAAAGTHWADS